MLTDDDPVLDYLLRDDDPEVRDDPEYRAHMRKTVAYDATALSFQAHLFAEDAISHMPRWLRPAFRGWQLLYRRWLDPSGHRIADRARCLGYLRGVEDVTQ